MWNTHTEGRRAPCDRAGWLLVALFALTLAGCGGGGETVAGAQPHVSAASAVSPLDRPPVDHPAVKALFANARVASSAPSISLGTLTAIETLFDSVAEGRFPQFFPPHQATLVHPSFRFRYYSATGTYVGVATVDVNGLVLNGVYVMGGPFGGAPVYIAMMYDFVAAPPAPTVRKLAVSMGLGYVWSVDESTGKLTAFTNKTTHVLLAFCRYGPKRSADGSVVWGVCQDVYSKADVQVKIDLGTSSVSETPQAELLPADTVWTLVSTVGAHYPEWGTEFAFADAIYFGGIGGNGVLGTHGQDFKLWRYDKATGVISVVGNWDDLNSSPYYDASSKPLPVGSVHWVLGTEVSVSSGNT